MKACIWLTQLLCRLTSQQVRHHSSMNLLNTARCLATTTIARTMKPSGQRNNQQAVYPPSPAVTTIDDLEGEDILDMSRLVLVCTAAACAVGSIYC